VYFIQGKDDGGGGDNNWSYKTCKVPVKSLPPTNRHPFFSGQMPQMLGGHIATQPTVSEH